MALFNDWKLDGTCTADLYMYDWLHSIWRLSCMLALGLKQLFPLPKEVPFSTTLILIVDNFIRSV